MARMADQDDVAAPLVMDLRLAGNLGHQRTGGIDRRRACGRAPMLGTDFGTPVGEKSPALSPSGTSSSSRTKTAPFRFRFSTTYLL